MSSKEWRAEGRNRCEHKTTYLTVVGTGGLNQPTYVTRQCTTCGFVSTAAEHAVRTYEVWGYSLERTRDVV